MQISKINFTQANINKNVNSTTTKVLSQLPQDTVCFSKVSFGDKENVRTDANFPNPEDLDLSKLTDKLSEDRDAHFANAKIKDLGKLEKIGPDADFADCKIEDLNLKLIDSLKKEIYEIDPVYAQTINLDELNAEQLTTVLKEIISSKM